MKQILILSLLFTTPAFAALPPDASLIQVHDMQMLNQQRFRMQEINDYNDVQTEKARYQKKNQQSKTVIDKIFNKKSKFVDNNGELKIEYTEY